MKEKRERERFGSASDMGNGKEKKKNAAQRTQGGPGMLRGLNEEEKGARIIDVESQQGREKKIKDPRLRPSEKGGRKWGEMQVRA